jgi:hypothetical protein
MDTWDENLHMSVHGSDRVGILRKLRNCMGEFSLMMSSARPGARHGAHGKVTDTIHKGRILVNMPELLFYVCIS